MQIILLRNRSGRARSRRLGRPTICLAAGLTVLGLAGNLHLATTWLADGGLSRNWAGAWQGRIQAQRAEIEALRKQSRDELDAVGRRLAAMQARLLRMEALGERVTEVADLADGEFDFVTPPAVGGPQASAASGRGPDALFLAMDVLEERLRAREVELELLESMLATRKFHEEVAIDGRPVAHGWISSGYGERVDPISGQLSWHAGVDFAGQRGADVLSVAAGVVVFAGTREGYGRTIEIDHGGGYVTRYGHHEKLLVGVGDLVEKGQVIGRMGSTGRSTGPHLHLEVLKDGDPVDPARYIARLLQG